MLYNLYFLMVRSYTFSQHYVPQQLYFGLIEDTFTGLYCQIMFLQPEYHHESTNKIHQHMDHPTLEDHRRIR